MDTAIKPILITLWLLALFYVSLSKRGDILSQFERGNDAGKIIDSKIKNFSKFLVLNAFLIALYGLDQIFSRSYSDNRLAGIVLIMTGLVLCLASYGIWNKYSWGRTMTLFLLILTTIIVIATTNLSHGFIGPTSSMYQELEAYFYPNMWIDTTICLIKMGYFAALSVGSIWFLEKPAIKTLMH